MSQQSDRHKGIREYKSGAAKRKATAEKKKKDDEVLAKTPRISHFAVTQNRAVPSNSKNENLCSTQTSQENSPEKIRIEPSAVDNLNKNASVIPLQEFSNQMTSHRMYDKREIEIQNQCDKSLLKDIGLWPVHMADNMDYWIKNFNIDLQYSKDAFLFEEKSSKQQDGEKFRKCNMNFFYRTTQNGERIYRSWLCFSPSTGRVYCFFCKLFGPNSSTFASDGFCDWKHGSDSLIKHETSVTHLKSLICFNNMKKQSGYVDEKLQKQIENNTQYWRKVLKRVIDVVMFLGERGLAFRGSSEIFGSPDNGNFLGIIELLAKYDPFLNEHIEKYGNCGSGKVNYLSSTIYEELIEEIGKTVQEEIIKRLKDAKMYSVSIDATKDRSHLDQLTIILRYVEGDKPVERFLKFLQSQGHKAKDMFNGLNDFLKENDIDLKDCRGQSYDNASAMSGKFNGLQALIMKENPLAVWVPCFGHSLNLVGEKASSSSNSSTHYFLFLQEYYVFFSVADKRWALLTNILEKKKNADERIMVPKRAECTRWSARAEANRAFVKSYPFVLEALLSIINDDDFDAKIRCEAEGIYKKMCTLETGVMAMFWNDILENLNNTSKTIQSPEVLLNTALECLRSLKKFVASKRDSYLHYEVLGKKLTNISDYKKDRIRRKNVRLNPLDYGFAPDTDFTPSERFRILEFIPLVDSFVTALNERIAAYDTVESRFGFLSKFDELTPSELAKSAEMLLSIYKGDLDSNLEMEFSLFQKFCSELLEFKTKSGISREQAMHSLIIEKGVRATFPNTEIVLKTYLTLMITNCTGERSFSKLDLVNNSLRVSMTQNRLNYLTIISLERDIVRNINVDNIIDSFAQKKVRKRFL